MTRIREEEDWLCCHVDRNAAVMITTTTHSADSGITLTEGKTSYVIYVSIGNDKMNLLSTCHEIRYQQMHLSQQLLRTTKFFFIWIAACALQKQCEQSQEDIQCVPKKRPPFYFFE